MRKVKLVVHECYAGKRKFEEVFAAVFLSNAAALAESTKPSIIELTDRSQDSLCSGKKQIMEQVRNEQIIYSAAVYCRLSKDDEQAGETSVLKHRK